MATASDFAFIIGDDAAEISDRTTSGGQGDENRTFTFRLDNPVSDVDGILTFMVRALSNADYLEPRILINGRNVGHVQRSVGATSDTWFTQIVRIDRGVLRDGENRLQLFRATPSSVTGRSDSYAVRAAVCHYRKTV